MIHCRAFKAIPFYDLFILYVADVEVIIAGMPKKTIWAFFSLLLYLSSTPSFAVGEQMIDAILRSDFIFDRNISNIPFIPLGWVQYTHQDSVSLKQGCTAADSCDFKYDSLSQGFGLPVWTGQKNMIILGQTLSADRLEFEDRSLRLYTGGILAAWIMQPAPEWQLGAFTYGYRGFNEDEGISQPKGNITGAVARYRHIPEFHTYWGGVRIDESDERVYYPYVGFDWYIGQKWAVTMLIPWPSVSYSKSVGTIYRLGALVSRNEWAIDSNGEVSSGSFNKVDIGFSLERQFNNLAWWELRAGYSGYGKLSLQSGSGTSFESDIDSAPFIRFAINFRPPDQ